MLCPGATRPPINKSFDPIRSSDDPVKTQGCEAWQNDMWQLAEIFDEPLTAGRRAVESVAVRVVAGKSPASTGSRRRPGESSWPGAPVPSARQARRPADVEPKPSRIQILSFALARRSWERCGKSDGRVSRAVPCGRRRPCLPRQSKPRPVRGAWCVTEAVTARRRNRDRQSQPTKGEKSRAAGARARARCVTPRLVSPAGPFFFY